MRRRTTDILLACHDCGVLRPVEPTPPSWCDDPAEAGTDAAAFATTHAAHQTAWLTLDRSETVSDRPLWDPMATLVFQATDGTRRYVVTARRESIEDPRTYRFGPGALEARNTEVEVDDGDLRRGLDLQFHPHTLRATKVDRFLSVVHEIVSHISPDSLEIAYDATDDPAVSVARMPAESYDELLARCSKIFDVWEWPHVSRFLLENRGEDGLLALRVRRVVHTVTA